MEAPLALVTGASRGIGRAVAIELARRGYDIAFCWHTDETQAQHTAAEINGLGRKVQHCQCDVADSEAVNSWVSAVERNIGPLDVVVNSAGITRDRPLVMMSNAEWESVLNTNLGGVFNVCRAAAFGLLKRKRGSIVNLSSVSGIYGNASQANYAASKAGIIGFSRTLAKEFGSYGIRVNVVAPGLIETDMTTVLGDAKLKRMVANVPLKRIGLPEEVARCVAFLASEDAAYVTGQILGVDGGLVF